MWLLFCCCEGTNLYIFVPEVRTKGYTTKISPLHIFHWLYSAKVQTSVQSKYTVVKMAGCVCSLAFCITSVYNDSSFFNLFWPNNFDSRSAYELLLDLVLDVNLLMLRYYCCCWYFIFPITSVILVCPHISVENRHCDKIKTRERRKHL